MNCLKYVYFCYMTIRVNSPTPPPGQLTTGLFRMKKNYARWRENGTPGWLLVYTLSGAGRFGYPNGELKVRNGDIVLLMPNTLNDYGLDGARWNLLWAYFFPHVEWHALLKWPEVSPGLMRLHLMDGIVRARILRHFMEAHRFNTGPRRQRELFAMNALEKTLLYCDEVNPLSEQARMDPRVLVAMNYICQNLPRTVKLSTVAAECRISVSRLAHLFREHSGQTPHQFLEMQRMMRAQQLLEMTDEPVAAIASELGFVDQFHFSHRFKRHLGLSPRDYRRNLATGAMHAEGRSGWTAAPQQSR